MKKKDLPPKFQELVETAIQARERAYVPYSHFRVGAALLSMDDEIWSGCNIENAAFSPTNCGERTAIFKAVSEGHKDFRAIAVAGWKEGQEAGFAYPCGVCRQVMLEFCDPDYFEVLVTDGDEVTIHTLASLIPHGFGGLHDQGVIF